jgi:uncharacterized protein YndB with AHSA1/START domain
VIFRAWTEPGALSEWMCPPEAHVAAVELDVQVGGSFLITMRVGDTDVVHTGEYQELRAPERLSFTWRSPNTHQQQTLVTIELFEADSGTRLVLTQRRLPVDTIPAHRSGWGAILAHLSDYLDSSLPAAVRHDP